MTDASQRTLYHIVRSNPCKAKHFRSNFEQGKALRVDSPKNRDLHKGVSFYVVEDDAHSQANLCNLLLGEWIAEVRIPNRLNLRIEATPVNGDSHHTVWGLSEVLFRYVVAVRPVIRKGGR